MNRYIALLRGINVSGQKKIKMADLKELFLELGFSSVITYIQSGNVVFESNKTELNDISVTIHQGIAEKFGFDVPVLILKPDTLELIYSQNPFKQKLEKGAIEDKKMYFTLLESAPDVVSVKELENASFGDEKFAITDKVVYFYAANGYGKTKLNNNFFERKLKTKATTRNLKTVLKLLEMSDLD